MLNGPLLPLLPEYPLAQLVGLIDTNDAREPLGAWLAGVDDAISICVTARGRCCRMLLSGDLGLLLARCSRVAVRQGSQPHVVATDALMGVRTLEVGITRGSAQNPDRLQELFPGAVLEGAGVRIPLQSVLPEVVLAECVTHGLTVTQSRIVYPSSSKECQ
jgi:hypothetical protein